MSDDYFTIDRGNGYFRLTVGGVLIRWTSGLRPGMFIIETEGGQTKTVGIEAIEEALERLVDNGTSA